MKKIDHLRMYHRMLDDQIDQLEAMLHFSDPDTERMLDQLKKQRLNIKDGIAQLEAEDAEHNRHKSA